MKAFVLHKWPYSETDWIVEFFLESGESRRLFARGARRSKKRFGHQFHSAGIYEIEFKDNRLDRCDLAHFYEGLSTDLKLWSSWLCILEWIRLDDASSLAFEELEDLIKGFNPYSYRQLFCYFFARQLHRHGLLSQIDRCLACDELFQGEPLNFSFSEGGLCHADCKEGQAFSESAREFLSQLLEGNPGSLDLSSASLLSLESVLVPFLEFQLGKNLKSFQFLQKIQGRSQKSQEKSWQNTRSPMF